MAQGAAGSAFPDAVPSECDTVIGVRRLLWHRIRTWQRDIAMRRIAAQ